MVEPEIPGPEKFRHFRKDSGLILDRTFDVSHHDNHSLKISSNVVSKQRSYDVSNNPFGHNQNIKLLDIQ